MPATLFHHGRGQMLGHMLVTCNLLVLGHAGDRGPLAPEPFGDLVDLQAPLGLHVFSLGQDAGGELGDGTVCPATLPP
ncbi:hypothetical protein [Streptomyces sp. NPDC058964]|uniref:hypothetical protein n=1 Tax=Streptomyces sp. NPDC058964 TaxID=3346681 RepID=UPI003677E536